ncbi:GmrSD restriction endonuclease domain-containing protein [Hymenobacter nivis]|uniref:AAA family ATPase n=1 Tax=Hymenobacter nivis TaxID=1850093 RepID=A0A2Z3GMI9_9BACT|nr:DUF262 domain-containing protein [Hymenobacter nivis]AWM32145.1 AAA family ATPase [Hymenobacter nivis]
MQPDKQSLNLRKDLEPELSIRGESIQRVYNFYIEERLLVNRRYQRKLVWNVEEKQKFLDSIIMSYPVPLFLWASVEYNDKDRYEIIDGMQRLNAITSFIEQEFGLLVKEEGGGEKEYFFDLDTMADTKLLKDENLLEQKVPMLSRAICSKIAGYLLPLSVYRMETSEEIDEIFRRINSGGRQLSIQEVRQSSSLGGFADAVRRIAAKIRGDDSNSDMLLLNAMRKISVSNKRLQHYGINVDDIFWVKQGIISREKMRQSNDEEIVADILSSMILYPDKFTSNAVLLNNMYGIHSLDSPTQTDRHQKIESELSKDLDGWVDKFIAIYDVVRQVMEVANESFNSLVNKHTESRFSPKHFQTIFMALYELIAIDKKMVVSYELLVKKFREAGKIMRIASGSYSGKNKNTNIAAVKGVFIESFRSRESHEENPAEDNWTTRLENILVQSYTEQSLYDFKLGLHNLDEQGLFNQESLEKIVKTLTAMANVGKKATGYIIIGVADNEKDASFCLQYYQEQGVRTQPIKFGNFCVTGVNGEVDKHYKSDHDKYMSLISSKVKNMPVESGFLHNNIRIWSIKYFGKAIVIFRVNSADHPVTFDEGFYTRIDSNTVKVKSSEFNFLHKKFS